MRRTLIVLLILFSILYPSAFSQTTPKAEIQFHFTHISINAGDEFAVLAEYTIPKDTHLTQNFLELKIDETPGFSTGLLQASPGVYEGDELIRRGKAYLKLPVQVAGDVAPGKYIIKGFGAYQICTEGKSFACFPPVETKFEFEIKILDNGLTVEKNNTTIALIEKNITTATSRGRTLDERLKSALEQRSFYAFLIVFFAGFITSLTPCIYPMIPITIGYIGARSAGGGKWRGFTLSLFYVMGLAIVYSLLGVLAALTGSLFGSITQTPLVIGFVSFIFVIMGLSMLGFFDLSIPSGMATRLQSTGPRKGYLGAIFMGMIAGLVAAPCAGPVIIVLLTFIATTKSIFTGFSLMMCFAFGMGILFIIIGSFSGLLSTLPTAGEWMDKIKKVFGILMLAAALWIARSLLPPPILGILIGIGSVYLGVMVGGLDSLSVESSLSKKFAKAIGIILLVCGIYIIVNLLPIPGKVIPQTTDSTGASQQLSLAWNANFDMAFEHAKAEKKYVLADFTAEWCAACKELEHKTFPNPDVTKVLRDLILVRVDCTSSRSESVKKILERFTVTGLPTIIVFDSEGNESARVTSFLPPSDFLTFVKGSIAEKSE